MGYPVTTGHLFRWVYGEISGDFLMIIRVFIGVQTELLGTQNGGSTYLPDVLQISAGQCSNTLSGLLYTSVLNPS